MISNILHIVSSFYRRLIFRLLYYKFGIKAKQTAMTDAVFVFRVYTHTHTQQRRIQTFHMGGGGGMK